MANDPAPDPNPATEAETETDAEPGAPSPDPGGTGKWWHALKSEYWIGIGVVVTVVIGVLGIWYSTSGSKSVTVPVTVTLGAGIPPTAQRPKHPARSLLEQIAQSSIWTSQPQIVQSAAVAIGGTSAQSFAAVEAGEPIAFTPSQLVDQAADWTGTPIYVVGRVAHVRAVENSFGLGQEVELSLENNEEVILGAAPDSFPVGEIIYALGKIAAVGQARTTAGVQVSAVYFLILNRNGGYSFNYDLGDAGSLDGLGSGVSDAVARVRKAHS